MTIGHFIWTDLSTYDLRAARSDYASFFGWKFEGESTYDFALLSGQAVAALFTMPPQLAKIEMPSFWMSYVHVEDVEATVAKARKHDGVIIEVEPQAFNEDARIALVRDPSGAGFTLYEGPEIEPALTGYGTVQSRYHHLPNVGLIQEFYEDLFGWRLSKRSVEPWPTYDVRHSDGRLVAQVEEVPQSIRGKFRYWIPCFDIGSISTFTELIDKHNGAALHDLPGNRSMFVDRQGAHFIVRETPSGAAGESPPIRSVTSPRNTNFAWKAALGLVSVWLAVFLDIQAFWGVLLLIWTWPALKFGRADFVEPVSRSTQPIMFWATVGTWIILSVWLIAGTFLTIAGS